MRTLPGRLSRATVGLVIDHIQPNFGLGTINIHVLEEDALGNTLGGFDLDGVTREELGLGPTASLLDVTEELLVAFVTSISDGLPVEMDEPEALEEHDGIEE